MCEKNFNKKMVSFICAFLLSSCTAKFTPPEEIDGADSFDVIETEPDIQIDENAEDAQFEPDLFDVTEYELDIQIDEDAGDAPNEPDVVAINRFVLFSDAGGGIAQNENYIIHGSITGVSCSESRNDSYILESCEIKILNP